jgi:hypothetical protein
MVIGNLTIAAPSVRVLFSVGLAQRVSGRKNFRPLAPAKVRVANGHAGCTNKTDRTKAYVESISRAG